MRNPFIVQVLIQPCVTCNVLQTPLLLINRPSVATAVVQTRLVLIDDLSPES